MRILFDIGHPGHVHLFKNLAQRFINEGSEVLFTTRDKEFEHHLLKAEGLPFVSLGKHYKSITGKIWGLFKYDFKLWRVARRFKPDLFVSHGSIYAAHAAFLLGKKHLALEDTGNMEQIRIYKPFTDKIISPRVLPVELGDKQVRYNGFHELAYLRPEYFQPDPAIYNWLGLKSGEPFAIIRFVSWNATHDVGQRGLSNKDKTRLVELLRKRMQVFISSEAKLPAQLEAYQFRLAPEQLHHALYHASLVISEGSTIASEAGVLGTPAIYINSNPMSYCQEQERYGLVYNTTNSEKVFAFLNEILDQDRKVFRDRRNKLIKDTVDVTAFLYAYINDHYRAETSLSAKTNASVVHEQII
ncbi:MAG: DUF354 domain-containing protein [Saprospiraceae bacterium]|nr:DUF354 domain-containing protein [Saprospiraceae bacterium]